MAPGKNRPCRKGEEMEQRLDADAMLTRCFLPPNKGQHLVDMLAVAAYIARRDASFWDWIALMEKYHLCYYPGCTTCGGGPARNITRCLTDRQLQQIVGRVTTQQIAQNWYRDWHNLMFLILKERPESLFEGTDLLRMYRMQDEMFHKLVDTDCWRPRLARKEVNEMVRSEGMCWMDLESANL